MIGTLNRYVDRLSDGYLVPAKELAVVRILFALQLLVFLPDPSWVSRAPDAFWLPPPGPFQHLGGPPSELDVAVLHWTVVALALAVLVGVKTGPTSVALTVGLVTLNGLTYSFGKVDHFVLHAIFPAVMAAAGWGRAWSVDARGGRHRAASGFPMLIWAIILAYSFLSASVPKILTGWVDPSREATRGYVAVTAEDGQRKGLLTDRLTRIDSHVFWKSLDYATVFAEGWLILAVMVPVLFRVGVAALPVFHLGVYLSLGFDFSRYVLVEAVMLVPWLYAAGRWIRSRRLDPP